MHLGNGLPPCRRSVDAARMKPIEVEVERTIRAPIDRVFARLADIEGFNAWMADSGSMLNRTRKTSDGPTAVGTTYVDDTSRGTAVGEVVELEAPHTIVFHFRQTTRSGEPAFDGWPAYYLERSGEDATVVRHHARMVAHGVRRFAAPALRRFVARERTTTMDALTAACERG